MIIYDHTSLPGILLISISLSYISEIFVLFFHLEHILLSHFACLSVFVFYEFGGTAISSRLGEQVLCIVTPCLDCAW